MAVSSLPQTPQFPAPMLRDQLCGQVSGDWGTPRTHAEQRMGVSSLALPWAGTPMTSSSVVVKHPINVPSALLHTQWALLRPGRNPGQKVSFPPQQLREKPLLKGQACS